VTTLALTINGQPYGPMEVRDELTMNDFLREVLGMTGTKFGCGAAQCLSCAVIVDGPAGRSYTSPTCIVPAVSFNGKTIRTVEGHAKDGELTALQKAFISHFAFQCGYLPPGSSMNHRSCSSAWNASLCRAAISKPPLPRRSTDTFVAAPATSATTRLCATSFSPILLGT
jgi:aerobic-type carbon monoxide dehydrogenase small subunit (CoxS/CutS family)